MSKQTINEYFPQPCTWLSGTGDAGHPAVISSRVRLARNLRDIKFTGHNTSADQEKILQEVRQAIGESELLAGSRFWRLNELTVLERQFLVERYLISHELGLHFERGAVNVGEAERSAIMINEEDHLRLQTIKPGLDLLAAYQTIDAIDSELGQKLSYGFSDRYGYLTACPTNTGTGLRASVMMHLPGLVKTKQVRKVLPAISRLGLAIRGIFGEGTDVLGNLFQISNQLTLGKSEMEVVENIRSVALKLIGFESDTRKALLEDKNSNLTDQVWRSLGLLKFARTLKLAESLELLSLVRLGVDVGIITDIEYPVLNKLLLYLHPAHLLLWGGVNETLPERKIDVMRADFVREVLK